ncbi:MAG: disulfide oxidoreductase [Deltaproteobacteria bacterium]|nr:disulfide oxidoreductase [Deltaproteobacteria bacterium]
MAKQPSIGTDTLVGDILRNHPELRDKVGELFGPDCLSCRSNRHETITYTSWHKGLDPEAVVRALNEALKKGK